MKKILNKNLRFFCENNSATRHIKYKSIDFVPYNKSIMANKLLSTNLERFLRRINSPLHALIARNISRVHCFKLAKMAIFKPPYLYEK